MEAKIIKQNAKKPKFKKQIKRWWPIFLMGLPGLAYFFINCYMPLYGILIAFKKFNYKDGIWGSEWAGFSNFKYLFATSDAWVITRNTIAYNVVFMILNAVLGVALAIFLNEVRKKKTKKIYQTLILFPYVLSYVVISYLAYAFLGDSTGLFNGLLAKLGVEKIAFYATPKYWPWILIFVYVWKSIGYQMIVYLSSVVGIDLTYYEAAELDGATKWQQIRYITLPMLKSTIIMLTTISMGMIFRSDFGLFYQTTRNQGLLYSVTDTIDTYVFRALLTNGDIAMSSAAAFYQSIVCFVTIMIFNSLVRKFSKESAMF